MVKHIYEHLKTRKKYNTLELKYRIKCEELEDKIIELKMQEKLNKNQKEQFKKEKEEYERIIDEYIKKLVKEKEKNKKRGKNGKSNNHI